MQSFKLGEKLRIIRLIRGLPMKALASSIGMSFQAYQKLEKGQTPLTNTRLEQLCEVLEIDLKIIQNLEIHLAIVFKKPIKKSYTKMIVEEDNDEGRN